MGKKTVYFMVFATALVLMAVAARGEEGDIFNDWVEEGKSFAADNVVYDVMAGVNENTAIIASPTLTLALEKGKCATKEKKIYCLEDWRYKIGGTVKIHGEDTQEFNIRITPVAASLTISRSIDNKEIEKGSRGIVTIIIENTGNALATNLNYEETIPPEFSITNTFELEEQAGNKLWWHGFVGAGATKELSYTIEPRDAWSGSIDAKLTYTVNGVQKELTNRIAFKALGVFDLNYKTDAPSIALGEETKVYVTLKNKQDIDLPIHLDVTFPEKLEVVASYFNESYDNVYSWNDKLKKGEEFTFITRVKGAMPGTATIKMVGETGAGITHSKVEKEVSIDVTEEKPELAFPKTEFKTGEDATFKIFLRNRNTHATLEKAEIEVTGPLLNKTQSIGKWVPNRYDEAGAFRVPTESEGSYPVKAVVRYELGGKAARVEKEGTITVSAVQALQDAGSGEGQNSTEQGNSGSGDAEQGINESGSGENQQVPAAGKKGLFAKIADFFKGLFGKRK